MNTIRADVAIIGGGILGLATALQLTKRFPDKQIIILEKEAELVSHQTGNNSGVLHSGIYYKPGSLRATNCISGKREMELFCEQEGITYDICGKVIVAVDDAELPSLETIYQRGVANGVPCEMIEKDRLQELEPHTSGIKAIHVPSAGIVDYKAVAHRMAEIVKEHGCHILTEASVEKIVQQNTSVILKCLTVTVEATFVINCAGLYCDRIATLSGTVSTTKIIPFRGEFWKLSESVQHLCRNLIYPVPDPQFPFLGVHFTRMIDGSVECGPNAVLAFSREGYRKRDINWKDMAESLTYPGFLRLAAKHWKTGLGEMYRSVSKAAFVKALQRLVPEISADDLTRAPAGVRAQALQRNGQLLDDFRIEQTERMIHVLNAPSPAATSSLNIGNMIVDHLEELF